MFWNCVVWYLSLKVNAYRALLKNPEGKRPLGTPRHRWKDNNTMGNLKELYARAGTGLFWYGIGADGGLL
jgi:hypothetical protein